MDNTYSTTVTMLATQLRAMKDSGAVFCFTTDECTQHRKRYIGVVLHSSCSIPLVGCSTVHLGLIRIRVRGTAEALMLHILRLFEDFGLKIEDFSGMTTDGAAVMKKLGIELSKKSSKPFYVSLCMAHLVHLAVQDAFTKDPATDDPEQTSEDEDDDENVINQTENLQSGNDDAEPPFEPDVSSYIEPTFDGDYGQLLSQVFSVCKKISRSPVLHDELLEIQLQSTQKELCVLLTSATRWDGTLRVLKRFDELFDSFKELYMRHNWEFPCSNVDRQGIRNITEVLDKVHSCSKYLQREKCTLGQADRALECLLKWLQQQAPVSEVANYLFVALKRRVAQRRTLIYNLARFVDEALIETEIDRILAADPACTLPRVTQDAIKQALLPFVPNIKRTDTMTSSVHQAVCVADFSEDYCSNPVLQVEEQAADQIALGAIVSHRGGLVTPLISVLKLITTTIPPTSSAPERMFSFCPLVKTKYQSRMTDDRFRKHMFLRDIHQKQMKMNISQSDNDAMST